jgi:hypothetical protein
MTHSPDRETTPERFPWLQVIACGVVGGIISGALVGTVKALWRAWHG